MPEALTLAAALVTNLAGVTWLALAMDVHWRQVRGPHGIMRRTTCVLRVISTSALSLSLGLWLAADHVTMAPLVWVMDLAAGALLVALALAWQPRVLKPLVAWVP